MKMISYRQLWRFYPFYLDLFLILSMVSNVAYIVWVYPLLPGQIPLALAMDGSVTSYGNPSLLQLLYMPLAALMLYLILSYVSYRRMIELEDGKGNIGLPKGLEGKLSVDFLTSFRSFSVQSIFSAIFFLVLAIVSSSFLTIRAAFGPSPTLLLAVPWLFYVLALLAALLHYRKIYQLKKRLRKDV